MALSTITVPAHHRTLRAHDDHWSIPTSVSFWTAHSLRSPFTALNPTVSSGNRRILAVQVAFETQAPGRCHGGTTANRRPRRQHTRPNPLPASAPAGGDGRTRHRARGQPGRPRRPVRLTSAKVRRPSRQIRPHPRPDQENAERMREIRPSLGGCDVLTAVLGQLPQQALGLLVETCWGPPHRPPRSGHRGPGRSGAALPCPGA